MLFQGLDAQRAVVEKRLDALPAQRRIERVAELVETGDGEQLRVESLAEDACCAVPMDAGERAPAQRAVNMDVAAGDELGARADGGDDDETAALGENLLSRAHRLGDEQRGSVRISDRRRPDARFLGGALFVIL